MLEVAGLAKRFGGVKALDGVALNVAAGRVHALLGENGAGKSTLLKCLSGVHQPDGGRMLLDGRAFAPQTPAHSEKAGLRFVHQELNLVPNFTAYENAWVGRRYPRRGGLIDWRGMRARFSGTCQRYGLDIDIDQPVGRMSIGRQQIVEILRALMDEARILVLDEPTAALSEKEAAVLHRIVRQLASYGCAVIFVSHRLEEVMAIADDYTVLVNGATVGSGRIADTDRDRLVALMAGGEFHTRPAAQAVATGPTVLALSDFAAAPGRRPIDLTVAAGEIVGIYGIVGSGRSSLLKSIWGAAPHSRGGISIGGRALPAKGIASRIRAGVAFAPEDRRSAGLVMDHSILDNALLPRLPLNRLMRALPFISWRSARRDVGQLLAQRGVKYGNISDRMSTLSGGNQQKALIGRWVRPTCRLYLLDEPTRGVDVRSKAEIHALCHALAGQGAAVVFATSDIEELVTLAGRVLVMAGGVITLDRSNHDISRRMIVEAAVQSSRANQESQP
ncbi:sugar ABC transporter ATP-binding protein [Mesorhizobium loti]|nr:sugar ABC transporter ATP-binding protein [Mesorhizobium loti]PLP56342.1 sugar ABC transporter ATP-binding protein [Mesorhizobium loti]